jgi:outer membrane protein TolC
LFAGGAIQSAYEEAKLKSRQAGMTHQQKIQDQLLRAELLFWTILKTDQLRKVAEQQVSHLRQHLKEVEIFHQEGVLPQNEVLKTKVRLAEAQQRLLTTENNFRLAKMALNLLLHRPVEIPFELANPEEKIPAALPPVETALQTADERRPTLQAERMQVRIMRTKERLVKSDYYPKLSFLLSYDRSKETPMTLPENWEAMFLLRWNLWDWGKRTQEVKLAKLKTEQSEESVRAAEEALSLEVHERYLRVAETKEKIAMTKVVVEQAEENLRITQERFESNMTSNTEVLDAENLLTSSRANYANAFYDFQLENALFRSAIGLQAEGEG